MKKKKKKVGWMMMMFFFFFEKLVSQSNRIEFQSHHLFEISEVERSSKSLSLHQS